MVLGQASGERSLDWRMALRLSTSCWGLRLMPTQAPLTNTLLAEAVVPAPPATGCEPWKAGLPRPMADGWISSRVSMPHSSRYSRGLLELVPTLM